MPQYVLCRAEPLNRLLLNQSSWKGFSRTDSVEKTEAKVFLSCESFFVYLRWSFLFGGEGFGNGQHRGSQDVAS